MELLFLEPQSKFLVEIAEFFSVRTAEPILQAYLSFTINLTTTTVVIFSDDQKKYNIFSFSKVIQFI